MKHKKINQSDIAKEAGVARTTVSMILNGQEGKFSREVVDKVRKADEKFKYSLSKLEKIVPAMEHPPEFKTDILYCVKRRLSYSGGLPEFYSRIAFEIESQVSVKKRTLIIKSVDNAVELHDLLSERAKSLGGVILHGAFDHHDLSLIPAKPPCVMILIEPSQNVNLNRVVLDNEGAILEIVKYLASIGHKRLVFLGAAKHNPIFLRRTDGFVLALRKLDIKEAIPFEEINRGLVDFSNIEEVIELFLTLYHKIRNKPTAVVCGTSAIAAILIKRLSKEGINVPDDLSVTGFDNYAISVESPLRLTSIITPINSVVESALNLIYAIEKGVAFSANRIVVPCGEILMGNSTSQLK